MQISQHANLAAKLLPMLSSTAADSSEFLLSAAKLLQTVLQNQLALSWLLRNGAVESLKAARDRAMAEKEDELSLALGKARLHPLCSGPVRFPCAPQEGLL